MAQGEKIIGIDLGTTNSVVAIMEGTDPKVIPNAGGESADAERRGVHRQGETLVGEPARRQAVTNPRQHGLFDQAVHGPAAPRGRDGREDGALQGGRRAQDYVKVEIDGNRHTPQEISAKSCAS
jgi:molecular chaperone DnaK